MKKLIMTLGFALLVNGLAQGAVTVVCEKDGAWWYPKNDKAVKIANYLKVKSCNGKKFHALVKKLGLETNAPVRGKGKKSLDDLKKSLGK